MQRVLILLHDRGQSPDAVRDLASRIRVPGLNCLLARGPRSMVGKAAWYVRSKPVAVGTAVSLRQRLFGLIDELEARGWDSSRIFVLGLGEGARAALELVFGFPRPFAGVIAVGGDLFLGESWSKRLTAASFQTPWLIAYPITEDAAGAERVRNSISHLQAVGLPVVFSGDTDLAFLRQWIRTRLPRVRRELSHPLTNARLVQPVISSKFSI